MRNDMTEFEKLIRERYEPDGEMEFNEESKLLLLLNGPLHYQNEEKMLEYAENHPDATMDELIDYGDSITPDGLAPGDDGSDLLEDDEEEDQ